MIDVLLAAPGLAQEPALVVAAGAAGLRVVRRCVDAVELLAAGAADAQAVVVVSADLPRLSADVVDRLGAADRVVGLADGEGSAARLREVGVQTLVDIGASASATLALLAAACSPTPRSAGVWPAVRSPDVDLPVPPTPGRLIAVWGPMGAPGRTTIALGLAEALADRGLRVCSVDADTYAPSMAMALGVVEESSGLVVGCRQAEGGGLDAGRLVALTRRLTDRWHLLGGLPDADRWPDLRSGALERVWDACRQAFDATVVDVGFCLERDEAGAWARQRNAAALTALGFADHVVAVADASAAGAARLAAAWPSLAAQVPGAPVTVVRNRAAQGHRDWVRALGACGVRAPVHDVPADARALARCWAAGRSLREGARRSPVRRSLAELARTTVAG